MTSSRRINVTTKPVLDEVARRRRRGQGRDHLAELRDVAAVGRADFVDLTDARTQMARLRGTMRGLSGRSLPTYGTGLRIGATRWRSPRRRRRPPAAANPTAAVHRAGVARRAGWDRRRSGQDRTAAAVEKLHADAVRGRSAAGGDRGRGARCGWRCATSRRPIARFPPETGRLCRSILPPTISPTRRVNCQPAQRIKSNLYTCRPRVPHATHGHPRLRRSSSPAGGCRRTEYARGRGDHRGGKHLERIVTLMEFGA